MAKPETVKKTEDHAQTAVAVAASNAVAISAAAFAEDAGAGMENTSQESFAIPFLLILQKGSPQVDEAGPGPLVEGAKAGMLYENVTGRLIDGKTGVTIIPCAYRRVFLRWGARGSENSGFKGELLPEEVASLRSQGKIIELDNQLYFPDEDGTIRRGKDGKVMCDKVSDTRNHYVVILDDATGGWANALISLTSTQIKKSKGLMSAIASVKVPGGPSGMFTPPTFANLVKMTTVPESNDKGNWFGAQFTLAGLVEHSEVYAAAKAFHASVIKGEVSAKYEEAPSGEGAPGGF